MNRRELLQNGLALLSAVGIEGEVATISAVNPQAIVITPSSHISDEAKKHMGRQWKKRFAGTGLEDVPLIILEPGVTLQVIDQVQP